MPRTKGGFKTRQRRKKVLKAAKGYWGGKHRLFRSATEAVEVAIVLDISGPVVIADIQDNPGAGGTSDTTGLLAALVEASAEGAILGLLNDPEIAALEEELSERDEEIRSLRRELARWYEKYEQMGQRKDSFTSISGREVQPLYTPLDRDGADHLESVSLPGLPVSSHSKSSTKRDSLTISSLVKWLPIHDPDIMEAGTLMVRSTLGR